jgi:hypothetical protein
MHRDRVGQIFSPLVFPGQRADSKPVKQEVNGTVILPPLVFPGQTVVSFPRKDGALFTSLEEPQN